MEETNCNKLVQEGRQGKVVCRWEKDGIQVKCKVASNQLLGHGRPAPSSGGVLLGGGMRRGVSWVCGPECRHNTVSCPGWSRMKAHCGHVQRGLRKN